MPSRPDAEFVDVEPVLAGGQTADLGMHVHRPFAIGERDPTLDLAPLGRQEDRTALVTGSPFIFALSCWATAESRWPSRAMQTSEPTARRAHLS